jgi:hypothetical protein
VPKETFFTEQQLNELIEYAAEKEGVTPKQLVVMALENLVGEKHE